MPIYEYECEKCHLRFEMKRRFGEDGSGFCPQCGSVTQRVFSPVAIIFRGLGSMLQIAGRTMIVRRVKPVVTEVMTIKNPK